jgi:hypothetical protein
MSHPQPGRIYGENEKRGFRDYENLIQMALLETYFDERTGTRKKMTRYRLAKQTGLSWHTINKVANWCGGSYKQKTKKAINRLFSLD